MHQKRKVSVVPQDDIDDSRREYYECVLEIKKEHGLLGSLALHQEAMKRLGQRQCTKKKDDTRQPTRKKEGSFDAVTKLFRGELDNAQDYDDDDDEYSVGDKSHKSTGLESISNFLFGDECNSPAQVSPLSLKSSNSRPRVGLDSLAHMFRDSVSVRSLISSTSTRASGEGIIRRRCSVTTRPEFEESFNSRNLIPHDLELSDSDNESVVSDKKMEAVFDRKRGSFRDTLRSNSGSVQRRASLKKNAEMAMKEYGRCRSSDSTRNNEEFNTHEKRRSSSSSNTFNSLDLPFHSDGYSQRPLFKEAEIAKDMVDKETFLSSIQGRGSEDTSSSDEMISDADLRALQRAAARRGGRRSSLASVDEDKVIKSKNNMDGSIQLLDESFAGSLDASYNDGSLICGWGRSSMNNSIESFAEGEVTNNNEDNLICNWGTQGSSCQHDDDIHAPKSTLKESRPLFYNLTKVQCQEDRKRRFSGFDFANEIS